MTGFAAGADQPIRLTEDRPRGCLGEFLGIERENLYLGLVLSAVLPGLRSLRSSFVAGSLLLASLYVLLSDSVRESTNRGSVGHGLASLSDEIGDHGWLAVAGVGAYLLGSMYVLGRNLLLRNLSADALPKLTSSENLYEQRSTAWRSLTSPFSRPSLRRLGLMRESTYDPELARGVCLDIIFGGGKRLLVANKDLFDEYDRLVGEAEFRDAVTGPGLAFIAIVLFNTHLPIWLDVLACAGAVMIAIVLFFHARALDREANSMYAHAVADGYVSTAVLDQPDKPGRRRRTPTRRPANRGKSKPRP